MRFGYLSDFTIQALVTVFSLTFCVAVTNGEDSVPRIQKIAATNSLDLPGKTPFHLKLAFQVYDLEGKLSDTGILEEWWAAPGESLLTLTSSAAKIVTPVPFDDSVRLDLRERYLLRKLLESELHPVPTLAPKDAKEIEEVTRNFDEYKFKCLKLSPNISVPGRASPLNFCVDPQTDELRVQYEAEAPSTQMDAPLSITHNRLTNFHGTFVAIDLQIRVFEQATVIGKVVGLGVRDPSKEPVNLSKNADLQSGGCIRAKVLTKIRPQVPSVAKAQNSTGLVILHGVITKQGNVKDVAAIATRSRFPSGQGAITQAAIDAFEKWTYEPCLLNGQPSEFEITVSIDFERDSIFDHRQ